MSKPIFFIITPSYNQAKFVAQTIRSVLQQRIEAEIVYLVRDGGSTDGTKKIARSFGKKINFVSRPDKGQADAINQGLKEILRLSTKYPKGDLARAYVAYLNSDDYYLPNAFSLVDEYFASHPNKNWLVGEARIIDEKSREIQAPIKFYKKILRWFLSQNLLLITNPIPQPAVFWRLSAAKKAGQFDQNLRYTMDYEYWLKLHRLFGNPGKLSAPLACFRIHGLSKGKKEFLKQFEEQFMVAKRYTKNQLICWLHQAHNFLITTIYQLIK